MPTKALARFPVHLCRTLLAARVAGTSSVHSGSGRMRKPRAWQAEVLL